MLGAVHGDESDDAGRCIYTGSSIPRPHSVAITEFGAVGDGVTLNTVAFQNAVFYLKSFADKGGAQLYVPKGRWLTGSFNLTSHLTLFLEQGATILGTEETSQWPVVDPLPSYGRGIDLPGRRHRSLISGYNVRDVVITGENGVIDGQGSVWWDWFRLHNLNYSRPHLIEFVDSAKISISNLTFLNAPAWAIHPVYCSDVIIHNITVQTALDSPGTDGIVPDSCLKMCIEDCRISVGRDAVSLKSGWDGYGISSGKPTSDIHISRINVQSSSGSGIAFGSEMSGGISSIYAEGINIHDSSAGISFRTAAGRGGYIEDILILGVQMVNVGVAIELSGQSGGHPDDQYDLSDLPMIHSITLKNMVGRNISIAGVLNGIPNDPFTDICLSNLNFTSDTPDHATSWACSHVTGFSELVFPQPCSDMRRSHSNSSICYSPETNLLATS